MMNKRILSVVLAVVVFITLSFAACSKKSQKEADQTKEEQTLNSEETQKKTEETESKKEEKPDPFGKYNPTIVVTSVRTAPNPATVKYAEGESVDNNAWTQAYENELGIKVKYNWVVDATQWEQKTNIMIA